MNFFSLFTGIGAPEKGLKNMGIQYELVGFSEIDKHAVRSYCAIHGVDESMNFGDITKIDETALPKDIDLITYGFPCQDISLSGKMKGLFNEDGTQTRSGLFFEALRIIEAAQPRVAIAENVKNLTSKKFAEQFKIVLDSLEQAGYNNYWQVLNAKDYGIPQNRERVFIVSIRKDIDNGSFKFPEGFPLELRLKDMLEDEVDEKYYMSEKAISYICATGTKNFHYEPEIDLEVARPLTSTMHKSHRASQDNYVSDSFVKNDVKVEINDGKPQINMLGLLDMKGNEQVRRVYGADGISPTLNTMQGENRQPKVMVREATKKGYAEAEEGGSINLEQPNSKTRRGRVGKQVAQTLTTSPQQAVVLSEPTIQRVDIPQTVKVRKYPVDCKSLCECLRDHKVESIFSNKDIAEILNVPLTKVEHWFRRDDCFAIPDPEIWPRVKRLLQIETNEFDESIMTFEEKEGVYEKSERHYFEDGIMPTLTSTTAGNEKIITR